MLKLRLARGNILDFNSRGWEASIARQRGEIELLFEESPSLNQRVTPELLAKCYRNASRVVEAEYDVAAPVECPFSVADVLGA